MAKLKRQSIFLSAIIGIGAALLDGQQPKPLVLPIGKVISIRVPLGLPPVPIPPDNFPTAETLELGRRLFFDPILSVNQTISCASCHKPQFTFADNKPLTEGVTRKTLSRNVPTIVNAAYFSSLFWDGHAPSLEEQVKEPIRLPEEMGNTVETVEQRLNADLSYRAEFAKAWGTGAITFEMVKKSIATFERMNLEGNSPFDQWRYGHDETAVSESVKRGFAVFTSPKKGNCSACHLITKNYALFTDDKFHDIGVGVEDGKILDVGRYAVSKREADRGKFKTPSLRNIALTAPYMHDGSLKDLKQVMDFYIGAGNTHANLDREIRPLDYLTGSERRDLMNFLRSLTTAGRR